MSLPYAASLEAFSLAELRDVVGRLVGEVRRLHWDNASLQARVDAQQVTMTALRAENQALRDEMARLKGLPPRPPSRPSGMEQATQPGAADTRPKPPRGVKRDAQAITAERVLKATVPAGSRFKGYEDILVRDLRLSAGDRRKIGGRNNFRALNGVVPDVCRDCLVSDSGRYQLCFQWDQA